MKPAAGNQQTTVGVISAEVLAFTAGKDVQLDRALVEADCLGTAAHVTMLSRMPVQPPIITSAERKRVVKALAGIIEKARHGRFHIRLKDQDVHLAVERTLTEQLGDLGKKIHTGRSRNDQVALDLRLYGRDQLLGAMEETANLSLALLAFARRHARVPMVGRTHMQPAMPSSVGLWASAVAEELGDGLDMLQAVYHVNNKSPLGSAASYGVPLPIDRQLVSDLLAFREPCHNVLYANHGRGRMESLILSTLAQVMLTLARFAQDLLIFTMPEFGYFTLPDEFCTGSSIMPQKKNLDVCELVRAKAARVEACAAGVYHLLKGLPSGYNRDLQEAKEPFLDGTATSRACLRIMTGLVGGLGVRPEALRRGFTPDVFATDRALELVAAGMPFRDAYHHVKEHLGELGNVNPVRALALKKHLGAPAGLDFAKLARRPRSALSFVRAERRKIARAVQSLLKSAR